jgi:hypothetical protein
MGVAVASHIHLLPLKERRMPDEREPEFVHIHSKAKTAELLQKRITMHQELGFELVSVVPVASGVWPGDKVWHAFMKRNTARWSANDAQALE